MRKSVIGAIVAGIVMAGCGSEERLTTPVGPTDFGLDGPLSAAEFLSCLEGEAAIVSAHRGGPRPGYPENAIETFLATLEEVPALIEVDVRETSDGVLVLMHDETVDRTTNGSGKVASMTLAEAKALRLVDDGGQLTDFQIPTLTEALEALRGRTVLQLDVKRGIGLRQVTEAVEAADAEAYVAIITYTDGGASAVARASDDVSIIATVRSGAHLGELRAAGINGERLVAWTGIVREQPLAGLYALLGDQEISTSGGAIGSLDDRAADGGRGLYSALESAGLDIIATDRPIAAAREIGTEDIAAAANRCANGQ